MLRSVHKSIGFLYSSHLFTIFRNVLLSSQFTNSWSSSSFLGIVHYCSVLVKKCYNTNISQLECIVTCHVPWKSYHKLYKWCMLNFILVNLALLNVNFPFNFEPSMDLKVWPHPQWQKVEQEISHQKPLCSSNIL